MHIIDGNNLAGKMDLLKEKNFDERLVSMIRAYNGTKQRKIFLVFDSLDVMGDRRAYGKLAVIYTPRDSFYNDADDKILELIREAQKKPIKEEIIIVTDDIGIKKKAAILKCILKGSADFARELREELERQETVDEKNNLGEEEMDDITNELLKKWKK